LLFVVELESLLVWSVVCGAACAQTETLPPKSSKAPSIARYALLIVFIF